MKPPRYHHDDIMYYRILWLALILYTAHLMARHGCLVVWSVESGLLTIGPALFVTSSTMCNKCYTFVTAKNGASRRQPMIQMTSFILVTS